MAFSIAGRAGVGPGRLWPHHQSAAGVYPGDGAAARAYGVDFNHGHADGVAAQGGSNGLFDAPGAERDIGGSAAHIQGNDVRVSGLNASIKSPNHAARRAAENSTHRLLRS